MEKEKIHEIHGDTTVRHYDYFNPNNRPGPNYQETIVKKTRDYGSFRSFDRNEHTFIHRVDLNGFYVDEWIQQPETDPMLALDTLFYEIKDFLEGEYSQDIMEERNIYLYHNYQLVKQALEKKGK